MLSTEELLRSKMHQMSFGSRAPPETAGELKRFPRFPEHGRKMGMNKRGEGKE